MLRLSLLGGVTLQQTDGGVDLADRGWRRAALLALVAAGGSGGVPREQLLSLLWPDAETERARHSLDELLSRIRRETGERELFMGTQRLALNPERAQVDVWEFERAVAERHAERAITLYRGHFAANITLGSQDLEHRIDATRARFARLCEEILEHAASTARSRGDISAAARWWRRRVELDPLADGAVCELIGAYAALGETVQALRVARVHAQLVREQLDAEPAPRVSEWIERLQARAPAIDAPMVAPRQPVDGRVEFTGSTRILERATSLFGARYRMVSVVEDGSVLLRVRAAVPEERMREVDFCFLQPRVASLIDPARFAEVFARACNVLDSTILPLLDYGVRGDLVYFVTSPMPRETLRDVLRQRGALSVPDAVRAARGIAQALSVAHRHGLSHGDLRPKHVATSAQGELLVANFGLVETITRDPVDSSGTTAVAFGSPRYLSPEQLEDGRRADPRSDVFSFGALVFHMLSGTLPSGRFLRRFPSAEWDAELLRHRPQAPAGLREIVIRCLSPHPSDRFQHGDELLAALTAMSI